MRVVWSAQSRRDFVEISKQYVDTDPDYPVRTIKLAEAAARRLAVFPHLGAQVPGRPFRKLRLRPTPIILIYHVTSDRIEIARLLHAARDWQVLL